VGLEILVARTRPCPLAPVLEALVAGGVKISVAMVDGVLQGPGATVPTEWRDVRLRTPAGMVALRRMSGGIAVLVFGNAGPELQSAQRAVADAVRATP
jgi:hypothetical protein